MQPLAYRTNDGRELIHVHIPKNAGMSVWQVIGLPEGVAADVTHRTAFGWRKCLGADRYDAAYSFAVVRHPCDRLLSTWSFFRQNTFGMLPNCNGVWRFKGHGSVSRCHYRRADRLATAEAHRVANLLRRWSTVEDFLFDASDDVWKLTHFCPQWQYLHSPYLRPLVTQILRFEHLDEDWAEFCGATGLDLELPQTNGSEHANWKSIFTPEMISRVAYLYYGDFALLPYSIDEEAIAYESSTS